ncbi:MAG: helix-turn-helix transcriptional regulator [Chloroflexota bacterium]
MVKRKRGELAIDARRRTQEQAARLGGQLAMARRRRRLTQRQVGDLVGVARSTISAAERGGGAGLTLDTWQRLALAVDRPLIVDLQRDRLDEPADAGHLAIQELILRLGRRAGYRATFELPTRPDNPRYSVDVGLRDDRRKRLVLVEAWNTIGNIGAAVRPTNRKIAEADAVAASLWGEGQHRIAGCWVVRATRANRELVARYPELFSVRFGGSSIGWVRALEAAGDLPSAPGLIWADIRATRLYAWRRAPLESTAG